MAEDLFEDTNLKVFENLHCNSVTPLGVNTVENQEIIYENLKEKTIQKMNTLGSRIEKILELNENTLCNEEATLLLFQSVKTIYQELILLKEDVNVLKNHHKENN